MTTINPCSCGSTNLSVECTGTSHYTMDYVLCVDCKKEGSGEFDVADAINAWNRQPNSVEPLNVPLQST